LLDSPWSGRRLPEHSNPNTSSVLRIFCSSGNDSEIGRSTIPEIFNRNAAGSTSGCP
jgi:hypothetical protein